MTTEDKAERINNAIQYALEHSEFNVADLSVVTRQCARLGINQDEVQQYIARLAAADVVRTNVVGRSYYIIPKN